MRARLETYLSTQSAGALKLVTQVRFRHPLHRRSPQRDAQDIGMAMNPHWLQGFPRRPRRRLRFSAAARTQARERSRLAGATRSHSSDREGYARTGRRAGSAGACAHVLYPVLASIPGSTWAGRPESAADHETRGSLPSPADRQAQVSRSRRVSDQPAAPRAGGARSRHGRGKTVVATQGQLEGNGPYLVGLRSPGRAPGGPGTRPGLTPASTPSTSTAPGRDGDRRGGTSHRAGRCWPAAWAASPPPARRCDVPSLRRPRWLRA